jgi:hypothetical protein
LASSLLGQEALQMIITFTPEELSKFASDIANWYNEMTMFVLTNMASSQDLMDFRTGRGGGEVFHKWCKRYQAEHPKPSWKDLLPE